jgi:hypothetical protein
MASESILALIDAEIAKLIQARKILAKAGTLGGADIAGAVKKVASSAPRKRVLSPDARKRIADAQRKRWAAQRAKSKKEA